MPKKDILNFDNTPFADASQAEQIAEILRRETGASYQVEPHNGGFAIVSESEETELHLRPAYRSQIGQFTLIAFLLISYMFLEPLYGVLSVDLFVNSLNEVAGHQLISHSWLLNILDKALFFGLVILSLMILYAVYSRRYSIGPNGVEATVGLISKDQFRMDYSQIRGSNLKQSIPQRLLQYGSIEIASSGTDGSEIIFLNIADPSDILSHLRQRSRGK